MFTSTSTIAPPAGNLLYEYLAVARKASKTIDRVIEGYGDATVLEYAQEIMTEPVEPLQPISDFLAVTQKMAEDLLGFDVGQALANDLRKHPTALTANHHGMDFFAQSVQGSLLFALARQRQDSTAKTALVLSCGNIPLDNITYPQGILIYGLKGKSIAHTPRKLPVLPNKLRRWAVSLAPGINKEMLKRSAKSVVGLLRENLISERTTQCLQQIIEEDLGRSPLVDLTSYSDQSTLINDRLWQKLLPQEKDLPRIINLELEKVASELAIIDLANPTSLLSVVLFEKRLRSRLLNNLEGHRACWKRDEDQGTLSYGTCFFWGLTPTGRKFGLLIENTSSGEELLTGYEPKGNRMSYPFNAESINILLQQKKILPSVFTCFLSLALARGINCLGGYYQSEYLPDMQSGLLEAMRYSECDKHAIECVQRVTTDGYLSGMQTVLTRHEDGSAYPAGPVEMLAEGGLTGNDLDVVAGMSLESAHLASMIDTISDVAPWVLSTETWKSDIAKEYRDFVSECVYMN